MFWDVSLNPSRFMDPLNQLTFVKLFGISSDKQIPIAFLNAVLGLEGDKCIQEVEYLSYNEPPNVAARRQSYVDLIASNSSSEKMIVQLHATRIKGFESRAKYFASKALCPNLGEGKKYPGAMKVIHISLLDFYRDENRLSDYKLKNENLEVPCWGMI